MFRFQVAWIYSTLPCLFLLSAIFLLAWFILRLLASRLRAVRSVRRKRLAKRTRVARDLHDSLLQTIVASKMVADDALEPRADAVRMRQAMSRLSEWLGQATKEAQAALDSFSTHNAEESHSLAPSLTLCFQKLWRHLWQVTKKLR